MCNAPSRLGGSPNGAHWASTGANPYVTNSENAAVCQPLTYDGSAIGANNQAVAGEGPQPTPLGYGQPHHHQQQHYHALAAHTYSHPHTQHQHQHQHFREQHQDDIKDVRLIHSAYEHGYGHDPGHASMVVPQHNHQIIAVGGGSGSDGFSVSHCIDPSSIPIAAEPSLGFPMQQVLSQQQQQQQQHHIDPSLELLSRSSSSQNTYIKAGSYPSFASSPVADQIIVVDNPDTIPMDLNLLDNPLPEGSQSGWADASATTSPDRPMAMVIDVDDIDGVEDIDEDFTIITRDEFSHNSGAGPSSTASLAGASSSSASKYNNDKDKAKTRTKVKKQKVRGPFSDPAKRSETAATRRRRACVRCRDQRQRCEMDPDNPDGECKGCKAWKKESKKTIHRAPCLRGKITDANLVRQGGLGLTLRWQGTELHNVGDRVQPLDVRVVLMTLGTCDEPLRLRVVRFEPIEGDVVSRFWNVRNRRQELRLAPFCLLDVHPTADYFENYARMNAVPTLRRYCQFGSQGRPHCYRVIERTYGAALAYYENLKSNEATCRDLFLRQKISTKAKLFENLFILWFTSRHTTGSLYICGDETLDMEPLHDPNYPLDGKVSAPRMVVAQFDSIITERFLRRYSKLVLRGLEELVQQKSESSWWAVYLVMFILCRETSLITEDRRRHARQNLVSREQYTLPGFVEELHSSTTLLVQYWHYYNTKPWPDPLNPFDRHNSCAGNISSADCEVVLMGLSEHSVVEQLKYRKVLRENNYTIPPGTTGCTALDWDHPLYWVSQMYEPDWTPHKTFRR
jgi:hypothetical protein